jgi:hypothetical protein
MYSKENKMPRELLKRAREWIDDTETAFGSREQLLTEIDEYLQKPVYSGWYCSHCERGVDASEVTYHEQHTVCGRVISNDQPPKTANE